MAKQRDKELAGFHRDSQSADSRVWGLLFLSTNTLSLSPVIEYIRFELSDYTF